MKSLAIVLLAGAAALTLVFQDRGTAAAQDANRRNPGPGRGQPAAGPLRHVVLFKFKSDATAEQIKAVEEAFAELPEKIDSIQAYEWGTDVSPEMRSQGFTHCFLVTFRNADGRDAYLPHAAHQEFVKQVLPILDDVLVVDYQAQRPTQPAPGGAGINVVIRGELDSQAVAIGAETTGFTISASGATWELDLGDNPQIRRRAARLHGRTVRVTGEVSVKQGVEVKQRTIVKVQSLQPLPER
jgi:hypothetical protein